MRSVESVCRRVDGRGDAAAAVGRAVVVSSSGFLELRALLEEQVVQGKKLLFGLTEVDESGPNKGRVVGRRP